jgi:hypothetical protein
VWPQIVTILLSSVDLSSMSDTLSKVSELANAYVWAPPIASGPLWLPRAQDSG